MDYLTSGFADLAVLLVWVVLYAVLRKAAPESVARFLQCVLPPSLRRQEPEPQVDVLVSLGSRLRRGLWAAAAVLFAAVLAFLIWLRAALPGGPLGRSQYYSALLALTFIPLLPLLCIPLLDEALAKVRLLGPGLGRVPGGQRGASGEGIDDA